jgi:phenylalanyl-tRNA synthetase beta chain
VLAVVLTGARTPAGWWGAGRPAAWPDAIEAVRSLGRSLGLALEIARGTTPPWHPGRCAQLRLRGRLLGHAGELHPRVVAALELPARTCAGELDLEPVLAAAPDVRPAPMISSYPVATLDVALVVDADVPAGRVEAALRTGAGTLLESLRLFDVYSGPQVGPGRKSLAFALRLRAPDRTLTAEEATAVRDAAVAAAAAETGAVLRGS